VTKSTKAAKSVKQIEVVVRRLGKPAAGAPAGRYILIINPKVFGSVDNWLGGAKATFATRDEAIAAAPKVGGRVAA
jgi:hypothetical protein